MFLSLYPELVCAERLKKEDSVKTLLVKTVITLLIEHPLPFLSACPANNSKKAVKVYNDFCLNLLVSILFVGYLRFGVILLNIIATKKSISVPVKTGENTYI